MAQWLVYRLHNPKVIGSNPILVIHYFKEHSIVLMETCPICLEALDDNTHELESCGHKFHINCIVMWFRGGASNCPTCRNNPDISIHAWDIRTRSTMVIRAAKRKNASSETKRAYNHLQKLKQLKKDAGLDLRQFKLEHKQVLAEFTKKRRRHCYLRYRVRSKTHEMGMMNCDELPPVQFI